MTAKCSTWNLNAQEFTPMWTKNVCEKKVSLGAQITALVVDAGLSGIRVSDLPARYFEKFATPLDDFSALPFSDLSTLVYSLSETDGVVEIVEPVEIGSRFPKDMSQAMTMAGMVPENDLVAASDDPVEVIDEEKIGFLAHSVLLDRNVVSFVPELIAFKNAIVQVVYNFCQKNGALGSGKQSGLALSLFAAEWDRFHAVRQSEETSLKLLRDKFGAVKLMPFLQAIPELDVVGIHPEVRVRVRSTFALPKGLAPSPKRFPGTPSPDISTNDGHSYSTRPPSTGPRNISLSSELFGEPAALQTRLVLEQMMTDTQSQILALLSQVPSNPLAAANTVEQINQLQVLVNALKAALAVMPVAENIAPPARQKISLNSMLDFHEEPISAPPTPLSAAAAAGDNVGPLLADLSRILFTQVLQQKAVAPKSMVAETSAELERTLADIISAASSPPTSPNTSSHLGPSGRLIIPKSLPTSPIAMASSNRSTPQTMRERLDLSSALEPMEQLLRGLMAPPPGLNNVAKENIYGKNLLLNIRKTMSAELTTVPKELAGLSCKQAAPRVRPMAA